MHILIDGHNAMGALPLDGKTHADKRRALLRRVAALDKDATVYFDARRAPPGLLQPTGVPGVRVVFCKEDEADRFILDAVRDADRPAQCLVVSNDREVTGRAAQLGARTRSVRQFFGRNRPPLEPERRPPRRMPSFKPEDFGLPDEVDLSDPDID